MGGRQPSASYQAAKAATEGLVVHLAGRGGEHGNRINAVRPGRILTDKWEALRDTTDWRGRTTGRLSCSSATAAVTTWRTPRCS